MLNVTPGNDTMYILSQSMARGKQAGISAALGIGTGITIHTFFAPLGRSLRIDRYLHVHQVRRCILPRLSRRQDVARQIETGWRNERINTRCGSRQNVLRGDPDECLQSEGRALLHCISSSVRRFLPAAHRSSVPAPWTYIRLHGDALESGSRDILRDHFKSVSRLGASCNLSSQTQWWSADWPGCKACIRPCKVILHIAREYPEIVNRAPFPLAHLLWNAIKLCREFFLPLGGEKNGNT